MILCPFCNVQLDEELFNSVYGCETGCEFVRIEIECPKCKKISWDSGTFGSFGGDGYMSKEYYHEQFMEEFADYLVKLAGDRLKENK